MADLFQQQPNPTLVASTTPRHEHAPPPTDLKTTNPEQMMLYAAMMSHIQRDEKRGLEHEGEGREGEERVGDGVEGIEMGARRKRRESDESTSASAETPASAMGTPGPSSGDHKKKPGRKPLTNEPTSKRKAQNRQAQRAFRERKEQHVKSLEIHVSRLEAISAQKDEEVESLKAEVRMLRAQLKMELEAGTKGANGTGVAGVKTEFTFEFPRSMDPLAHPQGVFGQASAQMQMQQGFLANALRQQQEQQQQSQQPQGASTAPTLSSASSTCSSMGHEEARGGVGSVPIRVKVGQASTGSSCATSPGSRTPCETFCPAALPAFKSPPPVTTPSIPGAAMTTTTTVVVETPKCESDFCAQLSLACGTLKNPVPQLPTAPIEGGARSLFSSPVVSTVGLPSFGAVVEAAASNTNAITGAITTGATPGNDGSSFWNEYREGAGTGLEGLDELFGAETGIGEGTNLFDLPGLVGSGTTSLFGPLDMGTEDGGVTSPRSQRTSSGSSGSDLLPTAGGESSFFDDDMDALVGVGENDEEVVGDSVPADRQFLDCTQTWARIKQHPKFDSLDIDRLCWELRGKAKCSTTGPVLEESDVREALAKLEE
ncbi:DNA-binding transcription factor yap1 [Saitoella coloradoensis]